MTTSALCVDHVIVATMDCDSAARDYSDLGFSVIVGGTHLDGHTHNRLIPLADGSYIELVAPTDVRDIRVRHRNNHLHWLHCFNAGEGFAGYALRAPDLEVTLQRIRRSGYTLDGPREGARTLPDGRQARSLGANIEGHEYPAVVSDITPRDWRIPMTSASASHANGVTTIAHIFAAVQKLDEAVPRHEALMGVAAQIGTPFGKARTADFLLAGTRITIAEPVDRDSSLHEDLCLRGEVPFLVVLRTADAKRRGQLDLLSAHRARFRLV